MIRCIRRARHLEPVVHDTVGAAPLGRFASTASGRTHYQDHGTGPPVVLLHGSGRSHVDWQLVVPTLGANRRVIAVDAYGFGRSDRNRDFRYGYRLWSQQVVDLMDHLEIDQVTVVGHSLGGIIACMIAARHPQRVSAVITVGSGLSIDPTLVPMSIPGIGAVALARRPPIEPSPNNEHRAELTAAYAVAGTRSALLRYARRQLTLDGLSLLRGAIDDLEPPIWHISGTSDTNIPRAATRRLARRTGGTIISWPNADHYALLDSPEWLVDFICTTT